MINVVVYSLSGDVFSELVDPESEVWMMKEAIGYQLRMPSSCLMLVHGLSVLDDDDSVGDLCSQADTLYLTMVMSLQTLFEKLASDDVTTQVAALWDVAQLERGVVSSVVAACALLGACNPIVRQTVVEMLGHVGQRGNHLIVDAVAAHLEDIFEGSRKAAADCFPLVANRGDKNAIRAATVRLKHPDAGVRQAAVEALGHVVGGYGSLSRLC
mmetsp:Transcript_6283/g.17509  ORF Transcript_6283/g.17509 Transcript_6283/m.17509 type:complete len:213 (-) Transcript_6283:348-986(-)